MSLGFAVRLQLQCHQSSIKGERGTIPPTNNLLLSATGSCPCDGGCELLAVCGTHDLIQSALEEPGTFWELDWTWRWNNRRLPGSSHFCDRPTTTHFIEKKIFVLFPGSLGFTTPALKFHHTLACLWHVISPPHCEIQFLSSPLSVPFVDALRPWQNSITTVQLSTHPHLTTPVFTLFLLDRYVSVTSVLRIIRYQLKRPSKCRAYY